MTKSDFGEHLKREREMRGVSLDEICAATRISTRFLEALESEQWDRLPGGIFNRGFVRAVARFLGLDEENLVAEYTLATNDRPEVTVWAGTPASQSAGTRLRFWLVALLAVVVAAGGWFAWHRYATRRAARATLPAWPASPLTPQGPSSPPTATPAAMAPAVPVSLPSAAEPAGLAASATPTAGAQAGEPATLELTVAAGKTTRVSVIADGRGVFDGRMTEGQNQHFQARESLEITASNSSALLLELNGQTIAPMGPPGQPARITLTRKDLKKLSGGLD